jgi:colanic acid/amylovoran biosynthesis glycosyltransferase
MTQHKKIGVFLNKDQPAPSETFIQNHINHLSSLTLNAYRYLPSKSYQPNKWYRRFRKRISDERKNRKLQQILSTNKIEIVLAEYGMVGADCYSFCEKMSLPLVIHFHGQDAHRITTVDRYLDKYQKAFLYAKAIVVVSSFMKEKLLEIGAPSEKLFINVYGVDTKLFSEADIKNSPPTLFSAGRFVNKKAPYFTILSFKQALEKVPNAELIMAGDGYLFETCQRLINAFNLTDKVKLLGAVSHKEVAQHMQNCRAFAQHSLVAFDGDSEGTPNTILEAGASGVPVISTRHAGIRDVVIEGKTGLLTDEGDVDGMAQNMVTVLSNSLFAKKLGSAARKHVEENYSLENSINSLRQIIEL